MIYCDEFGTVWFDDIPLCHIDDWDVFADMILNEE